MTLSRQSHEGGSGRHRFRKVFHLAAELVVASNAVSGAAIGSQLGNTQDQPPLATIEGVMSSPDIDSSAPNSRFLVKPTSASTAVAITAGAPVVESANASRAAKPCSPAPVVEATRDVASPSSQTPITATETQSLSSKQQGPSSQQPSSQSKTLVSQHLETTAVTEDPKQASEKPSQEVPSSPSPQTSSQQSGVTPEVAPDVKPTSEPKPASVVPDVKPTSEPKPASVVPDVKPTSEPKPVSDVSDVKPTSEPKPVLEGIQSNVASEVKPSPPLESSKKIPSAVSHQQEQQPDSTAPSSAKSLGVAKSTTQTAPSSVIASKTSVVQSASASSARTSSKKTNSMAQPSTTVVISSSQQGVPTVSISQTASQPNSLPVLVNTASTEVSGQQAPTSKSNSESVHVWVMRNRSPYSNNGPQATSVPASPKSRQSQPISGEFCECPENQVLSDCRSGGLSERRNRYSQRRSAGIISEQHGIQQRRSGGISGRRSVFPEQPATSLVASKQEIPSLSRLVPSLPQSQAKTSTTIPPPVSQRLRSKSKLSSKGPTTVISVPRSSRNVASSPAERLSGLLPEQHVLVSVRRTRAPSAGISSSNRPRISIRSDGRLSIVSASSATKSAKSIRSRLNRGGVRPHCQHECRRSRIHKAGVALLMK